MTTTHTTKTLADELGVTEASVLVWADQLAETVRTTALVTERPTTGRRIVVAGYEQAADLPLTPEAVGAIRAQAVATLAHAVRPPDYGDLHDYQTGDYLRPATADEQTASRAQAERDGGAGVISVDGRFVYVQD